MGVLIAIGFKEFSSYFDVLDGVAPPPPPPPGSSKPNKQKKKGGPTRSPTELMLDSCVASLKLVTRKYARRQERWIKNRFVGRGFPVTRLDTTDLSRWDDLVLGPAEAAVSALVSGEGDHVTPVSDADRVHAWKKYSCDLCPGVLINGDLEWERHLKSKKHKRHARSASEGIKRSAPSCESSPPQSPSPEPDPKT